MSEETQSVENTEINDEAVQQNESAEQVVAQESSSEELKDAVEDAIENGASKEEVNNLIKEFELKVNGKVVKKKLDLSDEEALKRELQLAAVAPQSMQRTKELEKLYAAEIERLKANPWEVLSELGLDPEALSVDFIQKKVDELKKSPEQLEREKLDREIQEYRKKVEDQEKELQRVKMEQLEAETATELEKEIIEALDAYEVLPKNQRVVSRIAENLLWAYENGYKEAKVADILPTVEAQMIKELNQIFEDLPSSAIEKYMGKKAAEKYRQERLSKLKTSPISEIKETSKSLDSLEDSNKSRRRVDIEDFFKTLS